uniref:RNA-directed DNA polymerase n=1 Tax=Moniliophthora roreri TaxID=221103 RepID=A0A0W0FF01_MONRR
MADESGYDDQALIHIFRKGLPNSLSAKILNQLQGRPADLEGWYEAAIRYDEQYKYYEAVQKPKRFRLTDEKKKKVSINRMTNQLSDEEQKKYMADGRCFRCAKQGHMSRDCPTKQNGEVKEEKKKLSTREAYAKIRAIVFNVDGTPNKAAWITKLVTATYTVGTRQLTDTFLISGLGSEEVILGLPWLQKYNLQVDWNTGRTAFPEKRYIKIPRVTGVLDYESPEGLIHRIDIRAKLSTSQRLQHSADDGLQPAIVKIPEYLSQYQGQFEDREAERFPISRSYDHAIELKPEFTLRDCKVYSLTALEQAELNNFLAENLRKGYIRKSKSPMASPFFFVGKKEKGKLRPTQDYRRLNHGTVKNAYPLPLVSDLIDKLNGAMIFSKLDLCNGYNNVRIKDGDQWKAAFKTNRGLFEPTVMFFGLMNSPVTFQAFMDDVLQDFMAEGWCLVYMDDILIYSQNPEQHRERTLRLLQRLKEQDLYLKPHKCKFDINEIDFLGLVIKPGQIAMDPTKLAGISDWPAPRTVTGVRSFTGFTNFYRKFIGNYSAIAKPLYDLTKKGVPFEWTKECDHAFRTLKRRFQQEPVLRLPDLTRAFIIETDASKWASGGVLRQEGPDGELHPCGYISHAFDATERNYEIYDRELFAIVWALQTWRHYLMEGPHPVTVLCDHKNLTYFRTAQKLNRRQARWSLILSMFNLRLVHVPGREMVQSDVLSRRDDHVQGMDDDNDDVILLPERLFINVVDLDLQAKLQDRLGSDDFHKMTLESLTTKGVPPIKSALSDWEVNDSLIRYQGWIYVPDDVLLRREITKTIHEGQPFGHPGQFGTLDLVQRDYWWPGMAKFVKNFVDGCATCQQMKINTHPTKVGLQPIAGVPNATPFQIITMDLVTDLPESHSFDTVMVVVDHSSSKGVIFIPCTKTLDAPQAADLLLRNVYKRYGLPDKIISDRDPRFAAAVFQETMRLLGVKHAMSTAYHPQSDGETERVNQEMEIYLRMFCSKEQTEWSSYLHMAEFAHNNRTHSVTRNSPFFMIMGYNPRPLPTAFEPTSVPSVEERLNKLRKLRGDVAGMMEIARKKMIEKAGKGTDKFIEGQKVWLEGKNLDFGYPSKKLSPKREGPFVIEKVMGPVTYKLKLPHQWKIHPVFHAGLLKPYKETEAHGRNFLEPPPDIIEGHEEFEIEAIIGHKLLWKPRRFLVSWKGFDSSHNEWKTKPQLEHAMDLYLDYIVRNKLNSSYSVRSLPDTPPGVTAFADDVTYTGPFHPSPFELLFLVNTGGHDDALRNASVGQPHLQYAVDGLIRLRAQRVSLNAIIEETNVYAANLAFNAVAVGPAPLILQGPMTVPSLPPRSTSFEPQSSTLALHLGPLSSDVCDADPNSPEFLRAAATYNARIRAAVGLARDQYEFCPRYTGTEPVLPRQASPAPVVPKLESSPDPDPVKSEPDSDSPSDLVYPSDSSSRDLSPIYAQSIGVATASPSPTPRPSSAESPESQSPPAPAPASSDPFNPFDVNDEPLAPSTVPFLASGQFNPAFVSIRDVARANPGSR